MGTLLQYRMAVRKDIKSTVKHQCCITISIGQMFACSWLKSSATTDAAQTQVSCKIPLLEPQGVTDCHRQRALPTGHLGGATPATQRPSQGHPKCARHLLYFLKGASARPRPKLLALLVPKRQVDTPPSPKHTRMCILLKF